MCALVKRRVEMDEVQVNHDGAMTLGEKFALGFGCGCQLKSNA